jgi:hypothetical protein
MRLGDLGAREELTGSNGGKLALLYRIPAKNLPDESNPLAIFARGGDFIQPHNLTHATWGDSFELLGYSIDATDAPKRNLEVTLFFHALKPMTEDYTFSVKARDAKERTWGQEDKWTGDNSYATSQWSPGDLIIEKFYPGLNACAPAGDYRVTVEAYDPKTSQTFGDVVSLGTWHVESSQGNRLEDLEPEHISKVKMSDMSLLGWTATPDTLHPGDSFTLSLYWNGQGNQAKQYPIHIELMGSNYDSTSLGDGLVTIPPAGRGICSFHEVRVSPDAIPGDATIYVNETNIGSIGSIQIKR